MEKLIPIFGLCSFLFIDGVKANLQEIYKEEKSFNSTSCTYENAQYKFIEDYNYNWLEDVRFCVDYEKGTIFYIGIGTNGITKVMENGFLNKPETIKKAGTFFSLYQWSVEGDKLIQYNCTPESMTGKCIDGPFRNVFGTKR